MANIEDSNSFRFRKGNGSDKGTWHLKTSKLNTVQGCAVNPNVPCESCKLPVEKCSGNLRKSHAC